MPSTTPPRAVPSSLVSTMPETVDRLLELLRLADRVLAGVAVEHEQHLVRRAGQLLAHHALDLRELVHQALVGLQAAGGVDDHDVEAARARRLERVERDRRGIAAGLAAHDLDAGALAPRPRAARSPRRGRCRPRRRSRACPRARSARRACRSRWSCPSRSRRRPGSRAASRAARTTALGSAREQRLRLRREQRLHLVGRAQAAHRLRAAPRPCARRGPRRTGSPRPLRASARPDSRDRAADSRACR